MTFPAIGGCLLYTTLWIFETIRGLLSGDAQDMTNLGIFPLSQIALALVASGIIAGIFGSPVAAIVAGFGHKFTNRSRLMGTILAVIAGCLAFTLVMILLSLGTEDASFFYTWYLGVAPISGALGWVFCNWVYKKPEPPITSVFE